MGGFWEGWSDIWGVLDCLEYGCGWGWLYVRENDIYFGLGGLSVVLFLSFVNVLVKLLGVFLCKCDIWEIENELLEEECYFVWGYWYCCVGFELKF